MDPRPVGVFDSGVGGISVLGALIKELPHEHFLYYGDNANAPYGTKPVEQVLACVRGVMQELTDRGVKAVVIACNTATSVAASTLRQETALPIIGIEPALKPASELRRGGKILVLATPVTLRLQKFQNLMAHYGEGAIPLACPGLMELVEQEDPQEAEAYLRRLFTPYADQQVDAVVLGCTHYSFLMPMVRGVMPGAAVLDGNEGTARQLHHVLTEKQLLNVSDLPGSVRLLSSADTPQQQVIMQRLLKRAIDLADGKTTPHHE